MTRTFFAISESLTCNSFPKGVGGGEYNINITYDGNANFTGCSLSQKISIKGEVVEDPLANSTLIQQTIAEDNQDNTDNDDSSDSQDTYYTPSYTPSSSSDSGRQSSSDDSGDSAQLPEYDEDGFINYDENGKMIT